MDLPKITPEEIDSIKNQFAATLYTEGVHELRKNNKNHFVLGVNNDSRWDLLLFKNSTEKIFVGVKFGPHASNVHQGVQGGALASVLDAACFLAALQLTKQKAATAYLNVKYLKPAKTSTLYVVETTATHTGRKVQIQAALMDIRRTVFCIVDSLFIIPTAKM